MNTKISLLIREFISNSDNNNELMNEYHVVLSLLSLKLQFIENLPYISSSTSSLSIKSFKLSNNMICSKQLPDTYSSSLLLSSASSSSLSYSLQYCSSQGYGLTCNSTLKKNEHLMV